MNIQDQTFDGEKETIAKVYHILKDKTDLANIITDLKLHQQNDPKIKNILQRLVDVYKRQVQQSPR